MIEEPILITEDAVVNVYIVGYKNIGESIVIEILDSLLENPICGIIDCYRSNSLNWAFKFLKDKNINEIQFLLWSHPDEDHSKGLNDILNIYKDKIKTLYISEGLSLDEINKSISLMSNTDNENINYMKEIFVLINEISKKIDDQFIHVNHATREFKIPFFYRNGKKANVTLKPFAPLSRICHEERIKIFDTIINDHNHSIKKNKISIGFLMTIGERKLVFTGDMINEVLGSENYTKALKKAFSDTDFFKIPHHGGKSSDKFINLLPKKIGIASVTRYHESNPDPEVIKQYQRKTTELYCTSHLERVKNIHDIGVIKISIPFDNSKLIKTNLKGNACKL